MKRISFALFFIISFIVFFAATPQFNLSFAKPAGAACNPNAPLSSNECDSFLFCDKTDKVCLPPGCDAQKTCPNGFSCVPTTPQGTCTVDFCKNKCQKGAAPPPPAAGLECKSNDNSPNGCLGENSNCSKSNDKCCNSWCDANLTKKSYTLSCQSGSFALPGGGFGFGDTCKRGGVVGVAQCQDRQGAACGKGVTDPKLQGCCAKKDANGNSFECIDSNKSPISPGDYDKTAGTCGFVDRSNLPPSADSKQIPPPPSPPCTVGGWKANGQCASLVSAFGILDTDPSAFIKTLFAILLSFSGGIALLLIMKAGYQLLTSQGKPEQIQAGRDQLVAAIVGLMFLIFSMVLLQIIGYDILRIPGFSPSTGNGTKPNGPVLDHCNNSCESAQSCTARGGLSKGGLDCVPGSICCE